MKKLLFGIFAHPDDEAFGPSGTLLTEAAAGAEIHLILLTAGEAGRNPDSAPDLAAVRLDEWQKAGTLIGASSQTFLGYKDGQLNNQELEKIGHQLIELISDKITDDTTDVELMSTDLNGITGHIDHIVAGRASAFAFYRLKATDPRLTRLRLACVPRSAAPQPNTEWLFAEAGHDTEQVDETVDARQYREKIIEIMKAHHSQREDCQTHLDSRGEDIGLNYFLVKS